MPQNHGGQPRRKLMVKRDGITIGSTWVGPNHDPIARLNTLLRKVNCIIRPRYVVA